MMRLKGSTCILLLLGLLLAVVLPQASLRAQTRTADDEAIQKLCNDFFEALRQGGASGAGAYLRTSGAIEDSVLQALERKARAQVEKGPYAGRPDSWALVREQEVPGALRYRAVYAISYHDARPIAWRLDFYRKATGVWIFTNVQWERTYVGDFLLMPSVQFAAYKKMLEEKEK